MDKWHLLRHTVHQHRFTTRVRPPPLHSLLMIVRASIPTVTLLNVLIDDTVLLSLLSGSEQDHGPGLQDFVAWCDNALLELNFVKTKEMVIAFRRKASIIHGEDVDIVDRYKYLGSIFENTLRFEENTEP